MSPEYGIPLLLILGAFWFLIRCERKPDVLPPPSKDTERKHDVGFWS